MNVSLSAGAEIVATPDQAHYLTAVLRRGVGTRLRVFNGTDGEWEAHIAHAGRGQATLITGACVRPQAPEPDIWLAFALLKRNATDLVAQKATELGVSALLPVMTARSVAERANEARLAAITREAAEQCERLTLPALRPASRLADILSEWPVNRALFAAVERRAAGYPQPARSAVGLLVGPEGGFTPAELDLIDSYPFVTAVTLGPRILRAETASIVGLALLQAGR